MTSILKIIVSALLISLVSWLSGKKTALAGFLTALPLTTLLALAFSHVQWADPKQSVEYAKSIFVAVPISLLFFIPFLVGGEHLSFWMRYFCGLFLLTLGYFLHQYLMRFF